MEKRKKIVIKPKSKDSPEEESKKEVVSQEETPQKEVASREVKQREESRETEPEVSIEEPQEEPSPEPTEGGLPRIARRGLIVGGFVAVLALGAWMIWGGSKEDPEKGTDPNTQLVTKEGDCDEMFFDIPVCNYNTQQSVIMANETFNDVLQKNKIPLSKIEEIREQAVQAKFRLPELREGAIYTLIRQKGSRKNLHYAIFQPKNSLDALIVDFTSKNGVTATASTTQVNTEEKLISSIINDHFWDLVIQKGGHVEVIEKLTEALQYSVDLHHLEYNDRFKFIYDQKISNGRIVGAGNVKAIYFNAAGKEHYIYYFDKTGARGYFDERGRELKAGYLKSPVKIGRVSSPFGKRFHPVDKEWKVHLGTDFAAPLGTPIMAVADGTILDAKFRGNNGNYVKIQHKGPYKTQYLHMEKFGPGIKPGAKVRQGQVIGYVGMTGKTTGPHVCYRFWNKNQQVNPNTVKSGSSGKKIPPQFKQEFTAFAKEYRSKLNQTNMY